MHVLVCAFVCVRVYARIIRVQTSMCVHAYVYAYMRMCIIYVCTVSLSPKE